MSIPASASHVRRARTIGAHRLLLVCGVVAMALATGALPRLANAQCIVNGPENVEEGARYTLCAPSGYTYRWSGPGVSAGVTSRCITLNGRPPGLYEYTVSLYSSGGFQDRCTHVVAVGDNPGVEPEDECTITGPTEMGSGQTVQLCGPASTYQVHSYSWTGPGGFTSSSRCITASRPGVYSLTTRNQVTGHQRTCSHRVDLRGSSGDVDDCAISGPDTFEPGTRVRLCGPSGASSYRWTGPQGFTSTASCVTVIREGSYTLTVRDRYGATRRCTHYLDSVLGDDSEDVLVENCPRNFAFWSGVCRGSRADISAAELRTIARRVDERSQAFNWTNDVDGFCQALRPAGPMTQRKQAARQLAALLANICAAELGITARNGQTIGLDAETDLSVRGAGNVGELAALADRMLVRGRGNFATVNRTMQEVNSGRGVGPVCNE